MPPSKDPRAPRSRRLASHWFLLISREGSSPWNLDAAAFDCRSARWRAFRWSHAAGDPPVGGKGEKVRGFAAGRGAKAAVDERPAAAIPRGRARVQLPARAPGPGQRDDVELRLPELGGLVQHPTPVRGERAQGFDVAVELSSLAAGDRHGPGLDAHARDGQLVDEVAALGCELE